MRGWALALATAALAACAVQPPPPPPPPASSATPAPNYIVVRGTASALTRYPRGTRLVAASGICLRAGETLTVTQPQSGISLTFGEGCGQRVPDNAGEQTPAITVGALRGAKPNAAVAP